MLIGIVLSHPTYAAEEVLIREILSMSPNRIEQMPVVQVRATITALGEGMVTPNPQFESDPLWIIEAGEPDIVGYALQAAAHSDERTHWICQQLACAERDGGIHQNCLSEIVILTNPTMVNQVLPFALANHSKCGFE